MAIKEAKLVLCFQVLLLGLDALCGTFPPCFEARRVVMAFERCNEGHELCNARGTIVNIAENLSEAIRGMLHTLVQGTTAL